MRKQFNDFLESLEYYLEVREYADKYFSKAVAELLENSELRQYDLGYMTGTSDRQLTRYRNQIVNPTKSKIKEMIVATQETVDGMEEE